MVLEKAKVFGQSLTITIRKKIPVLSDETNLPKCKGRVRDMI